MPDTAPSARFVGLGALVARVLRTSAAERRLLEAMTERVLAEHPAWPWPLIEGEAQRRVAAIPARRRTPAALTRVARVRGGDR